MNWNVVCLGQYLWDDLTCLEYKEERSSGEEGFRKRKTFYLGPEGKVSFTGRREGHARQKEQHE